MGDDDRPVELPSGFVAVVRGARRVGERPVAVLVSLAMSALLLLPLATAVSADARAMAGWLVPLMLVPVLLLPSPDPGVRSTLAVLSVTFAVSVLLSAAWLPAPFNVLALPAQLLVLPLVALPALRWHLGSWQAATVATAALLRPRWPSTVLAALLVFATTGLVLALPAWVLLKPLVDDRIASIAVTAIGATVVAIAATGWALVAAETSPRADRPEL